MWKVLFYFQKECCNETFSVSSLFSCNRNECIKHLEVCGKIGKGIFDGLALTLQNLKIYLSFLASQVKGV